MGNLCRGTAQEISAYLFWLSQFGPFIGGISEQIETAKDRGGGFCCRNYINWTVMTEFRDLRRQNLEALCQIGFVRNEQDENQIASSRT